MSATTKKLTSDVRQAGVIVDRTVEVTFSERNVEAYVFTFG